MNIGFNVIQDRLAGANYLLKMQGVTKNPYTIDKENAREEQRISKGDFDRALSASRRMDNAARAAAMNKAILIIAKKKIKREIPDDEVGDSDLPQGKLKYDEVPQAANMLGEGGAGRVVITTPMSTGRGMLSNSIFGREITETLVDAAEKAKKALKDKSEPESDDDKLRKIKKEKK